VVTLLDKRVLSLAFWLHFACGAFFGLFLGFNAWLACVDRFHLPDTVATGLICMIGTPMACGLALGFAKIWHDWDNLSKRGKNW
jgi:hypothetical protein